MSGGTSESTLTLTPEGELAGPWFCSSGGRCERFSADSPAVDRPAGEPIDILASLVPDGLGCLTLFEEAPDFAPKSDRSCPQAGQDEVLIGLYMSHCPQAIPISRSITI